MAHRDVLTLRARLEDVAATALMLARSLEDLHVIGFEKGTTAEVKVSSGSGPVGVDVVGDPHARALWHRLEKHAKATELALRALLYAVGNLLTAGRPDDQLRFGSAISPKEFDALLRKQDERRRRGEYTPTPVVDQPSHPNAKKSGKRKP